MYTVAVKRAFIAQHYLIGGDWGAENELHSHQYALELQLAGPDLDQHGYLVDIVEIEAQLEAQVARYQDCTESQHRKLLPHSLPGIDRENPGDQYQSPHRKAVGE